MSRVSKSEYASRMGISRSGVSHGIKAGRIIVDDDGKIDIEEAEESSEDFSEAKTRKERALARLRELELRQKRGDLMDRRKVEARVFELARQERDAWALWPVRISAQLAAKLGVDVHDMQRELDAAVRDHLATLSEIKF